MKQTKLFFLFTAVCLFWFNTTINGQAAGDYGSATSGNWTATGTWIVCVTDGTWDGATPATTATSTTTNVWIRSGHTVVFDSSSKNCNNLTIENGGKLWANTTSGSPRYINLYGNLINNGEFGASNDYLGVKPYATTATISGNSSTFYIGRIQPQNVGSTIIIDANVTMTYAGSSGTGSSSIYNNGKDNITYTINEGKTLTTASSSYITLGSSGSSIPATGLNLTININGTITTGTDAHINLQNASGKTSTIIIGSTGVLNCNGNLLMPDGTTSTGLLNIANGGSLNTLATAVTTLGTSTLTTIAGTMTANGAVNENGRFQINSGGWATGTGVWKYGPAATLEFSTNANYGVNSDAVYWPATDGPATVKILQGGVLLNTPRTVATLFETSGAVLNTYGNDLTVPGTVRINTGGYFDNFSPIYFPTSTLEYNTGGSYTSSNEWIDGATAGYGVPQNVTITNATALTLSGGRTLPGALTLTSGDINTGNYALNLAGTTSGTGTILTGAGGGTVGYVGTTPQTITNLNANNANMLLIANPSGVSLGASTTVGGLFPATGHLFLGDYDLTILSPNGLIVNPDPATLGFIVTNGTGSLKQMIAPGAPAVPWSNFPVGASTTSYDPVNIVPLAPAIFSVKVGTTLPAPAPAQYIYAAKVWDISFEGVPSPTTFTFTPSNPISTVTSDVIGNYENGNYTNVAATRSGNSYTASFATFSKLVTGTYDVGTSVSQTGVNSIRFDGQTIHNPSNALIQVFDSVGKLVVSSVGDISMNSRPKGIYILKSAAGTQKIVK